MDKTRFLALILAGHFALALGFGVAMPIFEEYDEISHVLFVRHLQAYHALPIQTTDTEMARAHHPPGYYVLGALLTEWIRVEGATDKILLEPNPYFRIELGDLDPDNKLRWVHYAPEERWLYQGLPLLVHVLRVLSAVFSTLAVLFTYLTAQCLRPGDEVYALLATALLAFIPEVTFNAGLVYNDTAALAGAAATLYGLSRFERAGWTSLRWAMIGVVFALSLMLKLSVLTLVPAIAGLWLVDAVHKHNPKYWLLNAVLLALPLVTLAGWWFWRNQILYGDWTANAVIVQMWGKPPLRSAWFYLHDLWRDPLGRFGTGEWASFPTGAYWTANAVFVMSLTGAVWAGLRWLTKTGFPTCVTQLWREKALGGGAAVRLWTVQVLTVSVVLASVLNYAINVVGFAQTRYLFPGYPSLMLILAAGFLAWWRGRRRVWGAGALGLANFALATYALFGIVIPVFGPPRRPSVQELRQITPLDAQIGEVVQVLGYRWNVENTDEDVIVTVHIYWKPLAKTPIPYTVFIHIVKPEVGSLAQRDTYPGGGNWATTIWDVGQPFVDTYHLRLRADQWPVQGAQVVLGLYDRQTLDRLPVHGRNTSSADRWVTLIDSLNMEENMPPATLVNKMKLKPGQRAAILNAPEGYLKAFKPLPAGVQVAEKLEGKFDWVQIFVKSKVELDKLLPRVVRALKPEGLLWLSFPKGTSKIQTDLTRDQGWEAVQQTDLKWVTLISVNDTWSAFALRPYKPGEERQSFR